MTGPVVLVSGWVGSDNLGDELIFAATARLLRDLGCDVEVGSRDPSGTADEHAVASFDAGDLRGWWSATRRADLVLLGGGGLIQDQSSLLNPPYHLSRLAPARLTGTPLAAIGLGVGPLNSALSRGLVRSFLAARMPIAVRDEASATDLRELGFRDVTVTADLAFLHDAVTAEHTAERVDVALRPLPRGGFVPASAHRLGPDEVDQARRWAHALDAVAVTTGLEVRLVAMEGPRDEAFHRLVAERMTATVTSIAPSLRNVLSTFSDARLVIGQRYHSLVAAIIGGVPSVGVPYATKVSSLADDASEAIISAPLDVGGLVAAAERSLDGTRAVREAHARLRERAIANRAIVERSLP